MITLDNDMLKTQKPANIVSLLLRLGLASVFLYAAISSLLHPLEWVGFLPLFMRNIISGDVLIKLFAVYELVLVIWLLSGKYVQYAGLLCTLTLAGIVLTNQSQLITTFRDIGLAFAALALYFAEK